MHGRNTLRRGLDIGKRKQDKIKLMGLDATRLPSARDVDAKRIPSLKLTTWPQIQLFRHLSHIIV